MLARCRRSAIPGGASYLQPLLPWRSSTGLLPLLLLLLLARPATANPLPSLLLLLSCCVDAAWSAGGQGVP
jgi:hypothetical protein